MFQKKFKLRIQKRYDNIYRVEYAYYRFIERYIPLERFDSSYSDSFKYKYFVPHLYYNYHMKDTIEFCKQFKTYEDIKKYNEEQQLKSEQWQREYDIRTCKQPDTIQII